MRNITILLLLTVLLASCDLFGGDTAVIWTDRPEFAIYAEFFNVAQQDYKVEVRYFESPVSQLENKGAPPDIVIGSRLNRASLYQQFRPVDALFKKEKDQSKATAAATVAAAVPMDKAAFYPHLLANGAYNDMQYFLPVSFNLPALIFSVSNNHLLSNPFTISFAEARDLATAYNAETGGIYARMGFSPDWSDEYLFIAATLFGANFREGAERNSIRWDDEALEKTIAYLRDWVNTANSGIEAVDDFTFKYFFDPPSKLIQDGRIFFAYTDSAGFFTLQAERRTMLDFRWIAENNSIPVLNEAVYYGLHKNGASRKAAECFTRWFFNEETQNQLLAASKSTRLAETLFGIGNGFSAMKTVTEHIYPRFYPGLLGHMPPDDYLFPPPLLPQNWENLAASIILPQLHDRIRESADAPLRPLAARLQNR